jgi:hypothetical protein
VKPIISEKSGNSSSAVVHGKVPLRLLLDGLLNLLGLAVDVQQASVSVGTIKRVSSLKKDRYSYVPYSANDMSTTRTIVTIQEFGQVITVV